MNDYKNDEDYNKMVSAQIEAHKIIQKENEIIIKQNIKANLIFFTIMAILIIIAWNFWGLDRFVKDIIEKIMEYFVGEDVVIP